MIAVGMGDKISIRLNASFGRAAGVYGKEMRIELEREMRRTSSAAVDPPDWLHPQVHLPPRLLTAKLR
jgi:hypothetical protein